MRFLHCFNAAFLPLGLVLLALGCSEAASVRGADIHETGQIREVLDSSETSEDFASSRDDSGGEVTSSDDAPGDQVQETDTSTVPSLAGTFRMQTRLDLLTFQSPADSLRQKQITDLAESPAETLLELIAITASNESSLGWFRDQIFLTPDQPDPGALTAAGEAFKDWIETMAAIQLNEACDASLGQPCNHLCPRDGGVAQALTAATIESRLACQADQDGASDGRGGLCTHQWLAVATEWMSAGTSCVAQAGIDVTEDSLPWSLDLSEAPYRLSLGSHAGPGLTSVHRALLYEVVLPKIFGDGYDGFPVANSLEDVIGIFFAGRPCLRFPSCCLDFAEGFGAIRPELNQYLLGGSCDALIVLGATALKSAADQLEESPTLSFMTAPASPCAVDGAPFVLDLGQPTEPCQWDIEVEDSELGSTVLNGSTFHGYRVNP